VEVIKNQWALVAIPVTEDAPTVVEASGWISEDIKDNTMTAGDIWEDGSLDQKSGLWVWEGCIEVYEADIRYKGEWRRPSFKEALRILRNRPLGG